MKKIVFYLVCLLGTLCIAQQNPFNKEYELQKFVERGGIAKELSPSVYKLTYRTGDSRTFYLNTKYRAYDKNDPVDSTIINVWEIDTTKYSSMFKFWQQVQVSNSLWAPQPVEDLNNNGRFELYGFTDVISPNRAGPVRIYEQGADGIFSEVFEYNSSTIAAKAIGDVNGDGKKEIVLVSTDDGGAYVLFYPVYKSDSSETLPTTFDFQFYLDTLQINEMFFGDWDNNEINDCAFTTSDIWDTTMIAIGEYMDTINNFQEVFQYSSIYESVFSGFAINDFDQDGKTEIVASSGPGNVFIIENKGENEYSIVNRFPFPIPNTYMQTTSNDIDGNGKPEFWIGGQDFEEGITVYQCYEADGDNSYKVVARIELRYATSFGANYIQAIDMDSDGKEELIISSGNVILILKFVGSPGIHKYKLWYAKLNEATQPGAEFCVAAIADFNHDGKLDLLIPMEKYTPSVYYAFSYILNRDESSGINDLTNNGISFEAIRGYPNPFNSTSTISFNIIEFTEVQLGIFDILGKEVNILLDKELSPGDYSISWDANDKFGNSLPSGIYPIVLKTKNSIKTFKSVLMK